MNTKKIVNSIILTFFLLALTSCKAESIKKTALHKSKNNVCVTVLNFETVATEKIPNGWKIENTNLKGHLPTWKVIKDKSALAGEKVLALTDTKQSTGESFNLCWSKNIPFTDGEVEVELKAVNGEEDQGGGVIWRAIDKNNYYIARFNPLEDNFRIYRVKNGRRKELKSANVKSPVGKWIKLKIVQRGNQFDGYINDKKFIEGTDDTFTKSGGVGLWTKADAATSFNDFTVKQYIKIKK